MTEALYIGQCTVCGYGRQLVLKLKSGDGYCIRCEECECEWESPEAAKDGSRAGFHRFHAAGLATGEEICSHPWSKFVHNLEEIRAPRKK